MNLSSLSRVLFAATLSVLFWSTSSVAANITIIPSGDSSYLVQGSAMDGVAGIELNISYVNQGTPTVKQEALVSGAILVANTTSTPGVIRIAIVSTRPFAGSGPIATISFTPKSSSAALPTITKQMMIDSKGAPFNPSTRVSQNESTAQETGTAQTGQTRDSGQTTQTTQTLQTAQYTKTGQTTVVPAYLGTVTMPTDQQQQQTEEQTTDAAPQSFPAHNQEKVTKVTERPQQQEKKEVEAKSEGTRQLIVYKGILDRFKQQTEGKNLSTMAALFDKRIARIVNQSPPIAISNGQVKAMLTIDIPPRISSSPNFAVHGGKIISFKQNKQTSGQWLVEVLPETGSLKVALTIIAGAEEFEFPLTVAPPVKTALTLDDSGWNRFVKEVGTAKEPLHDLNGDGVRNYMDEYIFVANYLAKKAAPASGPAKPAAVKAPKKR